MESNRLSIAFIITLFVLLNLIAQHQVALTFDDLPATHGDSEEMFDVLEMLTNGLREYDARAIGFVNEIKLYKDEKIDSIALNSIKNWLTDGFQLGNHTYSHPNINTTTLSGYKNDILRGQVICRPLAQEFGQEYKYFRYPYLRTGTTKEYQLAIWDFLDQNGYEVAPVTMDNDEYIYAFVYLRLMERQEYSKAKDVAIEYIHYLSEIVDHYQDVSNNQFGRNISHILLLHANRLNADYINDLLKMIQDKGYQFISIDEALNDPIYDSKEGIHKNGPSWIQRWLVAKGNQILDHPDPSNKILELFRQLHD